MTDPAQLAQLAAAARAMWGAEWPRQLAAGLGINPRTAERLAAAVRAGEGYPAHPDWPRRLADLVQLRAEGLMQLADQLRTQADPRSPVADPGRQVADTTPPEPAPAHPEPAPEQKRGGAPWTGHRP